MPFSCVYQLNNGAIDAEDHVIFKKYIDESFGAFHPYQIKIAEVVVNGVSGFIYSNSPGFPSTKGSLVPGDRISPDTKIAFFGANG